MIPLNNNPVTAPLIQSPHSPKDVTKFSLCSSSNLAAILPTSFTSKSAAHHNKSQYQYQNQHDSSLSLWNLPKLPQQYRSEERRVGKECRSERSQNHTKEK